MESTQLHWMIVAVVFTILAASSLFAFFFLDHEDETDHQ